MLIICQKSYSLGPTTQLIFMQILPMFLFFRKRSLKKSKLRKEYPEKAEHVIAKALVPARTERRKPGLSSSYYWIRNVGNSRWGSNFVCLPPGIDLSLSWNEYGRKKKSQSIQANQKHSVEFVRKKFRLLPMYALNFFGKKGRTISKIINWCRNEYEPM